MNLFDDLHQIAVALETIGVQLTRANDLIQQLLNLLTGKAVDLAIVVGSAASPLSKGSNPMPNRKASGPALKCPCLRAKSGGKGAVMPDVTLTSPLPASITLQPLNAAGKPVTLTPADTVTGTLTSDSPNFVITPGANTMQYVGTIPPNTPQGSVANLAATLKGTIQGAAANLTASVKLILDVPPSPVAVDLAIVFA